VPFLPRAPWAEFCRSSGAVSASFVARAFMARGFCVGEGSALPFSGRLSSYRRAFGVRIHRKDRDVRATRESYWLISLVKIPWESDRGK
jgi:hypothetical protein